MRKLLELFSLSVALLTHISSSAADLSRPLDGIYTPLSPLSTPRVGPTATTLRNGSVLVAGGHNGQAYEASSEIFDPVAKNFAAGPSMSVPRMFHSATLLRDGTVLIAGGVTTNSLFVASAEVFHPSNGAFTPVNNMTMRRGEHTATLLNDGRVLFIGGVTDGGVRVSSAEVFDPASNAFFPAGSLTQARDMHTATKMADGRVLVTGGYTGDAVGQTMASAEIFDPSTNSFSSAGSMPTTRATHIAGLLPDGKVLIAGGIQHWFYCGQSLQSSLLFDPSTNTFTTGPSMTMPRHLATPATISEGSLIVMSGDKNCTGYQANSEIYDVATQTFRPLSSISVGVVYATSAILRNGNILVVGGTSTQGVAQTTAGLIQ